MTFDLLISGGTVVDGSGGAPFIADVGICGDRIHAIGDLSAADARDRIDATGLIAAPGFVDVHNHASNEAEGGILNTPNMCPPDDEPPAYGKIVMDEYLWVLDHIGWNKKWPAVPVNWR